MKKLITTLVLTSTVCVAAPAAADTFTAGSVIIPMDTDHQDMGMLRAYGLVYELLRNGVPVRWVIKSGKTAGELDFVTDAVDIQTSTAITGHGYRGGPFVIDSADAAAAMPIITAWQSTYPETHAHTNSVQFTADVAKRLVAAPRVAMFADGNEDIARGYLQAAGIPDSTLDLAWADNSVDMLTVEEVAGLSTTSHTDGALFDEDGDPQYCQFMSMHWGVNDAANNLEVVEEVGAFLQNPTHFYAQCQAVNAFENHGHFLTSNGLVKMGSPNSVVQFVPDSPFSQIDGVFGTVGGSEPAFTLASGSTYLAGGVSLLGATGTLPGDHDVWMTGWIGGACEASQDECNNLGKVSYLGGHEYDTDVPISANPDTQGTRMFLNSLFDSSCATATGAPALFVNAAAPATVDVPTITFTLTYSNGAGAVASDAHLTNVVPAGTTFVSADLGGTEDNGVITWSLGNLGVGENGTVTFTVSLAADGTYYNEAELTYDVGLTEFALTSNQTTTVFGQGGEGGAGGAGGAGGEGEGTGGSGEGTGGAGAGAGGLSSSGSGTSVGPGATGAGGATSGDDDGDNGAIPPMGGDSVDTGGCACATVGERRSQSPLGALLFLAAVGFSRLRRSREDAS